MKIINAQEAKILSESKKQSTEYALDSIRIMAEAGHDYCTFEYKKIANPDELKKTLKELGYSVEESITGNYITAKW